jgi:hypothetical protein
LTYMTDSLPTMTFELYICVSAYSDEENWAPDGSWTDHQRFADRPDPETVSLLVDQARRTYLLLYGAEHEDKLQTQVSLRYLTSDELKASGVAPNQVADRQ